VTLGAGDIVRDLAGAKPGRDDKVRCHEGVTSQWWAACHQGNGRPHYTCRDTLE
jgi:hypothetical protein